MINAIYSDGDRSNVLSMIEERKRAGKFTVIDIGGSMVGWSRNHVDAIVDFNDPPPITNTSVLHFKCDITHPDSYTELTNYVEKHGKFDFCICTHVLEDIMNPNFVCEKMSALSCAGYVAFPSKFRELSRFEGEYRGYIHHRWIFSVERGRLVGYPKISYIETLLFDSVADISNNLCDLSFYWHGTVSVEYLNSNFLGPDVVSVKRYYNGLLTR
jgi:hypothetical protein